MRNLFRKFIFHPDRKIRTIITAIYCGAGIFANFFIFQVFCMPVSYAAGMCLAFFAAVLLFPHVDNKIARVGLYFLLGTGVPICLYCTLFLMTGNWGVLNFLLFTLAILFFGIGLLGFIPFYLLLHISRYFKKAATGGKCIMLAGMILPFVALVIYLHAYRSFFVSVQEIERNSSSMDEFITHLPSGYFTERRLGLCWKYHTNVEFVNDGWRPPLHDPFLVIAIWFPSDMIEQKQRDFWPVYMQDAIKYYHQKFPDRPLKESCPCSYSHDGIGYLQDNFDSIR